MVGWSEWSEPHHEILEELAGLAPLDQPLRPSDLMADVPIQLSATESLYQTRLRRYVTAMRRGTPDMVPIRPFVAEFTGATPATVARNWRTTTSWPLPRPAARRPISTGTPSSRTWSTCGPA